MSFDAQPRVEASGDLVVDEAIEYDFGTERCHGIFRDIPVKARFDDRYDRRHPISAVQVTASPGTPAMFERQRRRSAERLKIGDPDRTITGGHMYKISYRVSHVLDRLGQNDQLSWEVVNPGWRVPIERASAGVIVPGNGIVDASCSAGRPGAGARCSEAVHQGNVARFSASGLAPGNALAVVVAFPQAAVPLPRPLLEERWSARRAFALTPVTVAGSVLLVVVLLGWLGRLMWRTGRDRHHASPAGMAGDDGEPMPWWEDDMPPPEPAPPDGLRPAQLGVLLEESVEARHITATIVDLATRGHLRVEQVDKPGGWWRSGRTDWRLVDLRDGAQLRDYERALCDWLFAGGQAQVSVSDLRQRQEFSKISRAVYDDAVANGWFPTRPDRVRAIWLGAGIAMVLVGLGLVWVAAAFTSLGLLPVPVVVAGVVVLAGSHWMPRRTAKGRAMWRRAEGYRRFLDGWSAGDRPRAVARTSTPTSPTPSPSGGRQRGRGRSPLWAGRCSSGGTGARLRTRTWARSPPP